MRYVAAREPGPPDVLALANAPIPAPKHGEVLIKVAYAGVNRPDCIQRAGHYPPPPDASPVIGLEVAGVVVALGEGAGAGDVQIGDSVCALTPPALQIQIVAGIGEPRRWPRRSLTILE